MLMLRSTHERLMADARLVAGRVEQFWMSANERSQATIETLTARLAELQADYHELTLKVADFADRTVPPKRSETVKQPLSIDAADGAVVKKLKGIK